MQLALLYDGTCGLCDRTVRFVLSQERNRTLRFAPLAGPFAHDIVRARPELQHVDSVVWVDLDASGVPQKILVRSAAALRICRYLGGWWRLLRVFWMVPRPVRDRVYDLVAKHRHWIAGSVQCVTPTPESRGRFLDVD